MQSYSWFFILAVAAIVATVILSPRLGRHRIVKDREPIDLKEQYDADSDFRDINYSVFETVFQEIGRAYEIDPLLLRVTDEFQLFFDLDSWDLGERTKQLSQRLAGKLNIEDVNNQPNSIGDLIRLASRVSTTGDPRARKL